MRIRPPTAVSRTSCRVSHDDTDAGGVVRSATCLRFFERGWTEHLRERGFSVNRLLKKSRPGGIEKVRVGLFSTP